MLTSVMRRRRKVEACSWVTSCRTNREPALQSLKLEFMLWGFHKTGDLPHCRHSLNILNSHFENNTLCRKASIRVEFSPVSSLPSILPLIFYHILPELFLSMESQQEDRILYREWGVKFMQRKAMCYGKKYLLHGISLKGQCLARVLRMAALYLSHGRAILMPTAHYQCQEHLCKVVIQTCHLWEARSGLTECVSSVICVLKGVSFQPARRRRDEKSVEYPGIIPHHSKTTR